MALDEEDNGEDTVRIKADEHEEWTNTGNLENPYDLPLHLSDNESIPLSK